MAEPQGQGNDHIIPTAIRLGEDVSPISDDPVPGVDASLKHPATDGRATADLTSKHGMPSDTAKPSAPPLSRLGTDPTSVPRPQLLQKSLTAQPQRTSISPIRRSQSVEEEYRPERLNRALKYDFNPYATSDTDSSDSSEDEDEPAGQDPQKLKKKASRRDASPNPFSRFKISNEHFRTKGRVSKRDGRLKLSINETVNSGYMAKALGASIRRHYNMGKDRDEDADVFPQDQERGEDVDKSIADAEEMMRDPNRRVKLNICVIVIGSRGDIQPFLKIGKILKEDYGHRVRIATHQAFKKFVEEDSGLEFFAIGGDPSELMAFMVKNPGLIPSVETVKAGEIGKRRASMYEMFQGMWRACSNSTDDETDNANMKMMGSKVPFIADAIIANPPSFATPHIAERLGVPLHMMFTFPYTPTTQFPHPLANIRASNVDAHYTNFMTYPLVELMTWQGLGDLINSFREKTLQLDPVSTLWAPGQLYRLKVPYTYMWSPSLVPKPQDWGAEIDIAGFVFLELASSFKPPESLTKFLDDGPPPVYIGFGSIVVDDPDKFTKMIFEAVKMAGVRALVSKGWGGLGDEDNTPDNIHMLENTPHDWLFPRVEAVVHHGGAGTTAMGLKCGKPTMIVPFFGDQPFWGGMVSKARAGAHECIPYKKLTSERLAEGIKQCLTDEAKQNVKKIADSIAKEGDGALNAVKSFHRSLPLRSEPSMRCELLTNRVAGWRHKATGLRLSPLAAELLVERKKVRWNELRVLRHYEWNDFGGPGEPITGSWSAIVGATTTAAKGIPLIPVHMARSVKQREEHREKKKKTEKRKKHLQARTTLQNGAAINVTAKKGSNQQNGRPAAPKRGSTQLSKISTLSADPEEPLAEELAQEASHGFRKSGYAIMTFPMTLALAITQGFHNAPRLYGDETVRRPPRITGFHSGLRAGRDELIYGIYDGVTGLWKHPYHGAKEAGAVGFLQGVGMGMGGLVLKDIAAVFGPGAYTMKGLAQEAVKSKQPTGWVRKARIIQGRNEIVELGKGPLTQSCKEECERPQEQKEDIDRVVTLGWQRLKEEKSTALRKEQRGLRGKLGLKGKGHAKKGGEDVPRKDPKDESPQKASSTPIAQAEKDEEEGTTGRDRGATVPEARMRSKEKDRGELEQPAELEEKSSGTNGTNGEVNGSAGAGLNENLTGNKTPIGVNRLPPAKARERTACDTKDEAMADKENHSKVNGVAA